MSRESQQLRRLLHELENPTTRSRAVDALAALGEPAVGPLGRLVCDGDLNTSQAAARALAQIGAPAVETLCELLGDDDWNVSQSASSALARIGAPAVEPLCKRLGNPKPRVAHLAVTALAKIRKPAVDALCCSLANPHPGVRVHAARALVTTGSVAIPALTRALRRPEIYLHIAHREVTQDLGKEGRWLRASAAKVLAEIGDSALDVLCGELGSPEEELRRIAAESLTKCGEATVVRLARRLEFTQDCRRHMVVPTRFDVAVEAARILGRTGHPSALAPLLHALDHPNRSVRIAAASSLGELAHADRSPELRALIPQLRLRLVKLNWSDPRSDECRAVELVIRSIESATAAVAAVPLPSATRPPEIDTLPRPACPAALNSASLPITSSEHDELSPSTKVNWWSRFTRPFRDNP